MAELKIGETIRGRRKALKMPQWKAAEILDISQPTWGGYESGKIDIPSSRLPDIAEALETTVYELLGGPEAAEGVVTPSRSPIQRVPVVSWVSAGNFAETHSEASLGEVMHFLEIPYPTSKLFGLRIDGDSCDRAFPSGSEIVVDYSDIDPQDGRFYVFKLPDGRATVKRYRANPSRLEPYSSNPEHEIFFPTQKDDIVVVGRVVRSVHNF